MFKFCKKDHNYEFYKKNIHDRREEIVSIMWWDD